MVKNGPSNLHHITGPDFSLIRLLDHRENYCTDVENTSKDALWLELKLNKFYYYYFISFLTYKKCLVHL